MIYWKDPPLTLSCNHESSEVVVKLRSTASVLKNKHTCARVCVCVCVCLCVSVCVCVRARASIFCMRVIAGAIAQTAVGC